MGNWSEICTTVIVLAEAYPEGLTWDELCRRCFKREWSIKLPKWVEGMMGVTNGERWEANLVCCWNLVGGKYYYDPARKRYSSRVMPQPIRLTLHINEHLHDLGLDNLILVEPLTPHNSPACPEGIPWHFVSNGFGCTWDEEDQFCDRRLCGVKPVEQREVSESGETGGYDPFGSFDD